MVYRERLFGQLDELSDRPVTWISSPAGAGKTTLLASYVHGRGIPSLWYRVDEADNDVASFFYYMAEAAKQLKRGRNRPLPLFTPEYRSGMFAFTRHYFDSLFSRMKAPHAIVLDNYQDVAEESPFHEVIRNCINFVPEGIRVFVASRKDCPQSFISLKAEERLAVVGWEDIRFTPDEIREMISQRKKAPLPEEKVDRIQKKAGGWAAAAILMSEQDLPSVDQQPVFDYLAVEVFHKLPDPIKAFLLKTSVLSSVSPEIAARLTCMEESESILSRLRGNYFTECHGTEYIYHPLFREFLLSQARMIYRDGFSSLVLRAGEILAQSNHTEEAIKILLEAKAYREALPLILDHAGKLLKQGRSATLEEWAERLPKDLRDNAPWLFHWLGTGQLITNAASAAGHFEKAFSIFEVAGDLTGCLVSAANMVNAIMLQWDDYRPLDRWIEFIDKHVDPQKPLPSPEIEAHVASAMVCGLMWRMPWHQNMNLWIERTLRASDKVDDRTIRFTARATVMDYYCICGHFLEMHSIAEEFRRAAFTPDTSPIAHLSYMVRVSQLYDWINGSQKKAFELIQEAIRMAEEIGAHDHLGPMYLAAMVVAFEMNDLELAGHFIDKSDQMGCNGKRAVRTRSSMRKTFYLFRKGSIAQARQEAEEGLRLALETGVPTYEAYSRVIFAYVLRLMGEYEDAYSQLKKARTILEPLGLTHPLYLAHLTEAALAFDKGNDDEGRKALAEAFRVGRIKGYAPTLFFWWQTEEMARLCAKAFEAEIEVEYAKQVVRFHHLKPSGAPENLRQWPWPVKIYTLGRFELEINETALVFSRKVQKKPLGLLKAIIALGGKSVDEEVLQDLLWPDAEGDAAHVACKAAIFRLRHLLGHDQAILVREGMVSLNPEIVWLDLWAFESLAARAVLLHRDRYENSSDILKHISYLALNIYGGDFLPTDDDSWADTCRRRIRNRFAKTIEKLGIMLYRTGTKDLADEIYETALELGVDPAEVKTLASSNRGLIN